MAKHYSKPSLSLLPLQGTLVDPGSGDPIFLDDGYDHYDATYSRSSQGARNGSKDPYAIRKNSSPIWD